MKKVACLAVLAASLLPLAAWADCTYPKKPGRAPDGNKAPRAEMLAAKKLNETYQAEISAYLQCLKSEYTDLVAKNPTATKAKKDDMQAKWEKQNDAAVDEAQGVADRINDQIRLCLARNDNCKK